MLLIYNPPENSSYTQSLETDIFEIIENDIVNYSEKGKILIMGDLNARTGHESDFIENEEHDSNIPLFDDYTPDFNIINRLSQVSTVLPRGRLFKDICIQTGLRILNGRCTGDVTGNFTCHNYSGSSVVDYCSISESLLTKIIFFTVHEFLPEYSDHSQISAMLQVNCSMAENIDNVQPIPKPYRWDENSSYLFQEALSSFKFQSKINLMNETDYENKIENLISDLNSVLCGAADIVLTKTRSKTKLSTPKKT
jgi:hypothetical protein